jgi:hypothetical protein
VIPPERTFSIKAEYEKAPSKTPSPANLQMEGMRAAPFGMGFAIIVHSEASDYRPAIWQKT